MEQCTTTQGRSVLDRITKLFEEEVTLSPPQSTDPTETVTEPAAVTPQKKNIRRVVSISEFEQGTYQRMLHFQRKKQERIRLAQEEKAAALMTEVKGSPEINKASRDLPHVPIQDRVDDIVKKRNDWRERESEAKQQKSLEAESAELTFHPSIREKPRFRRSVAEFEVYLESVQEKRETAVSRLKAEREAKETAELHFKPEISHRSEKLMREKGTLQQRMEDEMVMCEIRKQELQKKYKPTFKPAISAHSQKLTKQRNAKEVFDRLYRDPGIVLSQSVCLKPKNEPEKETEVLSSLEVLTKHFVSD